MSLYTAENSIYPKTKEKMPPFHDQVRGQRSDLRRTFLSAAGGGSGVVVPQAPLGVAIHCAPCGDDVLETHGTLLSGKCGAVEQSVRAIACLAEGLGLRGTAQGLEGDPHTVRGWLGEAVDPLQAWSRSCLGEVHVRQVPLDTL